MQQCLKCHMDFEIEVLEFAEKGLAIVLTRWHNLGKGLDSADTKWYSHGGFPSSAQSGQYAHTPHALGSIRDAFENQEGISAKDSQSRTLRGSSPGARIRTSPQFLMDMLGNEVLMVRGILCQLVQVCTTN